MKRNITVFIVTVAVMFLCVVFIAVFICKTPSSGLAQDPAYYQMLNNQVWTVRLAVIMSFLIFVVLVSTPVCAIYFFLRNRAARMAQLYKHCPYCLGNIGIERESEMLL